MTDIVRELAKKYELTQGTVNKLCHDFIEMVFEKAAETGKVRVSKKNTFKRVDNGPRMYHNVHTGTVEQCSERSFVVFKRRIGESTDVDVEAEAE